jgi:hypothetical protein
MNKTMSRGLRNINRITYNHEVALAQEFGVTSYEDQDWEAVEEYWPLFSPVETDTSVIEELREQLDGYAEIIDSYSEKIVVYRRAINALGDSLRTAHSELVTLQRKADRPGSYAEAQRVVLRQAHAIIARAIESAVERGGATPYYAPLTTTMDETFFAEELFSLEDVTEAASSYVNQD